MNVWMGFLFMLDNAYHKGWIPERVGRKLCDYYDSFYK